MKNKFIAPASVFIFLLLTYKSYSQNATPFVTAYAGVSASLGRPGPGGNMGLETEYRFINRHKFSLGAKAAYTFPYRNGNFDFSFDFWPDPSDQSNAPYTLSHTELLFTGYYFLTEKKIQKGFFLTGATGLMLTKGRSSETGITPERYSSFNPTVEAGFGIHFVVAKKNAIEWSNVLQYNSLRNHGAKNSNPDINYKPFNRMVSIGTRICFGF
jgi:hypothetical protein